MLKQHQVNYLMERYKMTEINQSAEAMAEIRTIRKSVEIQAEGSRIQIAYLELNIPAALSDAQIHSLELESASLMRKVASAAESALFGF